MEEEPAHRHVRRDAVPRAPGGGFGAGLAPPMSNDAQKADQIAYRVYTKLALVLTDARAPAPPTARTDKWVRMHPR
jgi:hypothetical protein